MMGKKDDFIDVRDDFTKLKSVVSWLLEYAEYDEMLSEDESLAWFSFPNVVMSYDENELADLQKIVK